MLLKYECIYLNKKKKKKNVYQSLHIVYKKENSHNSDHNNMTITTIIGKENLKFHRGVVKS